MGFTVYQEESNSVIDKQRFEDFLQAIDFYLKVDKNYIYVRDYFYERPVWLENFPKNTIEAEKYMDENGKEYRLYIVEDK